MKRTAAAWAARTATAQRLTTGSSTLITRIGTRTAAWIRAGRRDDLTGLAAVLGCIARALIVAAGAYVLWRIIRAAPALLWALVPAWCWAALRAAPQTAAEHPSEEAPEEPEPDPATRSSGCSTRPSETTPPCTWPTSSTTSRRRATGRAGRWPT